MPGWVASVAWTALLSVVSACAFLLARCRGAGRPFGPTSKWWAFAVVVITSAIATGLGLALATAGHHLRAAYIGLIVPSGLLLGKITKQYDRRQYSRLHEALVARLTFFVRRMDDQMGVDLEAWCDARLRGASGNPRVLGEATTYYHGRIVGRWPKDDRRRQDLDRAKDSILHKVEVIRLINLDTTQARLDMALMADPSTSALVGRYTRRDLEARLMVSGENELRVMLADAYRCGRGKLLIYGLVSTGPLQSTPDSAPG
jgi:hypothetical protein